MQNEFFTVTGFYGKKKLLWKVLLKAPYPKTAARKALRILRKTGIPLKDTYIVDVFKGHCDSLLKTDRVTKGAEL